MSAQLKRGVMLLLVREQEMANQIAHSVVTTEGGSPNQEIDPEAQHQKPRIGGMLILIAVGLFLSLLQNLGSFLTSLLPVVKENVWDRLTNPGSPEYHPYWKPILIYEVATTALFLLMNTVALILFFQKRKAFPKFVVMLIPTIFILILVGYYLSGLISVVAESSDYAKQWHALVIRFIALHVWIPYFLLSKRVRSTFVR